jgi:hypothetical protein
VIQWFAMQTFNLVRGGYIEWIPASVNQLPIPNGLRSVDPALKSYVQKMVEMQGEGLEATTLEQELNDRVYHLFNLTGDEIKLIEDKLAR